MLLTELRAHMGVTEEELDLQLGTLEGVKQAITRACTEMDLTLAAQHAYVLATVEWETNRTFMPVKEAYWLSEKWRKENLSYYPFYGRGYVQLTWEKNYEKYAELLKIELMRNPDLALNAQVALFVLVHGFKTGWFTGHKLNEYVNVHAVDFTQARRCINAQDHALVIASRAQWYLDVYLRKESETILKTF